MKILVCKDVIFNNTKKIKYKVEKAYDNFIVISDSSKMMGLCDLDGKLIITPSFSSIDKFDDYFLVRNKLLYGLLDKKGNLLVSPKYNNISNFIKGNAIVESKERLFGFINSDGLEIINTEYETIRSNNISFIARRGYNEIVYDRYGNVIFDDKKYNYFFLGDNLYGFYKFYQNFYGKMGIISKDKVLLKEKYDDIKYLNDNRFLVEKGVSHKYIIDANGRKILKIPYDDTKVYSSYDVIVVKNGKKSVGLVINGGNEYIELEGIEIVGEFHFGIAIATSGSNNYFLINNKGKKISKESYYYMEYSEIKECFVAYSNFTTIDKYIYEGLKIVLPDEIDNNDRKRIKWFDYSKYELNEILTEKTVIAIDVANTYFMKEEGIKNTLEGIFKVVKIKDTLVLLTRKFHFNTYYMVCDTNGNIVIPLTDKQIFLINGKKIIIDNNIVNLDQEYFNVSYKDQVVVSYLGRDKKITFDTKIECDNYINDLKSWYEKKEILEEKLDNYSEILSTMTYEDYMLEKENKIMLKTLKRWIKDD